jgi:signal transduction histidine kinase/DNA-binding response OmpR family regulator
VFALFLKHDRDSLDKRVHQRTQELQIANTHLKLEVEERKRMQEVLVRAKEEVEAASLAKEQFLANMSHEIRTPMNGVIGMTELMLDTTLSVEQRKYLMAIKESADSLLVIINDILDFSKIEARKMELSPVNFSLHEMVDSSVRPLGIQAHQKGIELLVQIDPETPNQLIGDATRIRQILTNLMGNAVKFTSQGEILVHVGPAPQENHHPSTGEKKIKLLFEVSDNGIGISQDKVSQIFKPFEQADGSISRKYGGTGLGLAISKHLSEMMGGKIGVESELGKGSKFYFTIVVERQTESEQEAKKTILPDLKDLPVLVVDDNHTNGEILRKTLMAWQMRPTVVDNGKEVSPLIKQARQKGENFRLVILDACMPEMDGFEVAKRIKDEEELSRAIILMLSSSGHMDDVEKCRQLGISCYLVKPISRSDLLDTILSIFSLQCQERPMSIDEGTSENVDSLNGIHILLAEDNPINQKIAVKLLEKRKCQVTVASNGRQALDLWSQTHFDLILMDVQMPEMNGYEAVQAIREREKETGGHTPIIAMTAHAMKGDRETCLNYGMDDYVSKPIRSTDLYEAISRTLVAETKYTVHT